MSLPILATTPEDGSPTTFTPKPERLIQFEKHRFIVRNGVVNIKLTPIDDPENPVVVEHNGDPAFKTIRCAGVVSMEFEWVSGTPSISGFSYNA